MLTANLVPPLLDYWTARSEGVPAVQLTIRHDRRYDDKLAVCVLRPPTNGLPINAGRVDYSTNWAMTGPLVEKWADHPMMQGTNWNVVMCCGEPLILICRAVVRAAFGDEVEDLP